ncbi:alternative cyclin Pcl12 [Tremella mesenterica]|uniref:Alternative cyclin Pcl12 n=1 Tax=Tremella mesenterica TaxID=5217 RepID=A0A4Q1BFF5_TREME|nr:alternative cyclin Pcl12 [Tremella mesenterica]
MSSIPQQRAGSASPSTSSSRKAAKSTATASAPSSRPSGRSDPYYGHEETAVMCARFIASLFQCPNIPAQTAPGAPTPTLAHFVAYALHRTRLPSVVTFAALLLLQRLKTRFPAARGSSGHRLFISAFMISSKVICDDTYSNQSWGIVAQKMFSLKEINQMEREMCGYLEWNLNVAGEEVTDFERRLRVDFGPKAIVSRSSPTTVEAHHLPTPPTHSYPTPETTPDAPQSRPIRPVPSPYKSKPVTYAPPSPPSSPHSSHYHPQSPPQYSSSSSLQSSLQSSPASDDCKTPSPVPVVPHRSSKDVAYERTRFTGYPINVGGW